MLNFARGVYAKPDFKTWDGSKIEGTPPILQTLLRGKQQGLLVELNLVAYL